MSWSDRPRPVPMPRDARIDVFRGLLLVMIFVDHVPGNFYETLTLRNWGFSDAAESFFFMSGMAAGLAYMPRLAQGADTGLWPGIAPVWKRAWVLYLSHVFLTMAGIAIFALAADVYDLPDILSTINMGPVFDNTGPAIVGIVTLGHQIGYVNILPAYSALLLATPFAILLALRAPGLLLSGALLLWYAAGFFRMSFPAYPNPGGWFFNPFAWQLIFVVGLLTGVALRAGQRLVPVSRVLLVLAVAWLVMALVWMRVPEFGGVMNHAMSRLAALGLPTNITSHDKSYLPMLRLLHVLALVYVVSCLPIVARASAHRVAEPLRVMGRQGLLVFSAGVLLSLAGQALLAAYPDAALLPWVYIPAGVVLLWISAWLADWKRRAGRAAPADRVTKAGGVPAVPAE